jgi:hypothetical protein
MTDSKRTATEQLLISTAIDQSVSQFDFRLLAGQKVYFEEKYLSDVVDKGYLISSLHQQLLAAGCLLQEKRETAVYVVEARSGGVGTNNQSVLVGVPAMNVPGVVPGVPSQIPEIPFAKRSNQKGHAKLAVFAYNRVTGERILQTGTLEATATSKDFWLLGAGPFQSGTIRKNTTFAGDPIQLNPFEAEQKARTETVIGVNQAAAWNPQLPTPDRMPRVDAKSEVIRASMERKK